MKHYRKALLSGVLFYNVLKIVLLVLRLDLLTIHNLEFFLLAYFLSIGI
jgi:predicted tellurium resistance membrane protein TerC